MKKEYKVGDLVGKVSKLSEFHNKIGVVIDTKIAESGFIYPVTDDCSGRKTVCCYSRHANL